MLFLQFILFNGLQIIQADFDSYFDSVMALSVRQSMYRQVSNPHLCTRQILPLEFKGHDEVKLKMPQFKGEEV